jgi:chromosome segregation ATPase
MKVGLVLPLLLALAACEPKKQELRQLQDDVVRLQQRIDAYQSSFGWQTGEIAALLSECRRRTGQVNQATAAVDGALQQASARQRQSVQRRVSEMNPKLDEMIAHLRTMRAALSDVNARLEGMQQQLNATQGAVAQ